MVYVRYDQKRYRLSMEGHAGSGTPGQDLVCAAASILAYTLAANVQRLESEGKVSQMELSLQPGTAQILCKPAREFQDAATLIFDTVCTGFSLLAQEFPGNLRLEIFPR